MGPCHLYIRGNYKIIKYLIDIKYTYFIVLKSKIVTEAILIYLLPQLVEGKSISDDDLWKTKLAVFV